MNEFEKTVDEAITKLGVDSVSLSAIRLMQYQCHRESVRAGWWHDGNGNLKAPNVPTKLMLIVSEIVEAMEGDRADLMDDKLPHRKMIEVELADAVIRIFDLAERLELNIAEAMVEKMAFNRNRADHKIENRLKDGGKKY